MKMSDVVRRVSDLGVAMDDYWNDGVRKHLPTYPIIPPGVAEPPPPPEEVELTRLLTSLPETDLYTLLALVRLGQGRFPVAEFVTQRTALAQEFSPADAVEWLVRGAYLAADLDDAVAALRARQVDVDALQLVPA